MGMLSTAGRKIRSAAALTVFELTLVLPVFCLLGVARAAILLLPFARYARSFGKQGTSTPMSVALSDKQIQRIRQIGRVVRSTANVTPWRSLCLAQAMVAAFLLRIARIPHRTYFGVRPADESQSNDPFAAHSWVRCEDYNVTGGQNVSSYTVVNIFEWPARSQR